MDTTRIVSGMTLEEKCAQIVFPAMTFDAPDFESMTNLVKAGVGGICVYNGSVFEVPGWINSMQQISKLPLLLVSDFEDGAGQMVHGATVLPSMMAVGAGDSEELAALKGRVTAVEGRALGVPWNFSPVVDCNCNPLNPIINTRAFGEKPEHVIRMARAYLRGVREGGGLGCIKHYPGHGDVSIDSHIELPVLNFDRARLDAMELRPFRELAPDADAVMTGHILVKALDDTNPASISKAWHDVLRREMNFDRVIITDALIMGGIANGWPQADVVRLALQAGADILLFPQDPWTAIEHTLRLVRDKALDESSLDASVKRILDMKARVGLFRQKIGDVTRVEQVVGSAAHQDAARRIAEGSITLVRDEAKLLPLKAKSLAYVPIVDESCRDAEDLLAAELKKHARIDASAEVTVISVFFKPRAFAGKTQLEEEDVAKVREALRKSPRVIVVSFGSPYVLRQFPEASTYVCAFSDCAASQEAAAKALLGRTPFKGKLPVSLR